MKYAPTNINSKTIYNNPHGTLFLIFIINLTPLRHRNKSLLL